MQFSPIALQTFDIIIRLLFQIIVTHLEITGPNSTIVYVYLWDREDEDERRRGFGFIEERKGISSVHLPGDHHDNAYASARKPILVDTQYSLFNLQS